MFVAVDCSLSQAHSVDFCERVSSVNPCMPMNNVNKLWRINVDGIP